MALGKKEWWAASFSHTRRPLVYVLAHMALINLFLAAIISFRQRRVAVLVLLFCLSFECFWSRSMSSKHYIVKMEEEGPSAKRARIEGTPTLPTDGMF